MPSRQRLDQVWTVLDLIRWGTDYFQQHDIEAPRLTMELLLCHVLDTTRVKLYSGFDRPLLPEELSLLRSHVKRRAHHEPLQYITGKAWFYSLSFTVSPDVLIPRPETEHLVHEVIKWSGTQNERSLRGLDIGTGSGCIAIAIAHHVSHSTWLGIDRSSAVVEIAKDNAERLEVADRCSFERMDFLKSVPQGPYDIITMNPPYIPAKEVPTLEPEVRDYEPHPALTDDADGLTFYKRLRDVSTSLIASGGAIFLELGWQGAKDVQEIFAEVGSVSVHNDLQDIPRVIVVQCM